MVINPFTAILELSSSLVQLGLVKEKRKYADQLLKLENDYYEEFNKKRPDMATLDTLERSILMLSRAINSDARK